MKIAIQGFAASFHEIAAKRLYGNKTEPVYCRTFKDVFVKLDEGAVDYALVAIENSLYGSINDVYDLLLKHKFWICGEIFEQVGLHLMAPQGAELQNITDIYSMAPALAEAEAYLETHLPDCERHEHADTALAAKEVAEWNDTSKAAIASQAAAQTYNLNILVKNIETHQHNYTRFIALSRKQPVTVLGNKTSLTFRTNDKPGSLHAALGVFARHGINLTKLESRPIVGEAWQYMYYIDIATAIANDILDELRAYASEIRVLGVYQSGNFEII